MEGLGKQRDMITASQMTELMKQRDPDAFPILLAHHPHGFDAAVKANIPLTLSGHTHGGQLMLDNQVGVGPALFRYWSGVYRREQSQLVVSNGVGNMFPIRVNAPAEIVHLTLRCA
jgi:predicted MPP superfamily phosphohydrolase